MVEFLVTTDSNAIPNDCQVVMVDGTVPGWTAKHGDLHFDHHRPSGADIQIDEIPHDLQSPGMNACFVTTLIDADACVAAAFILLDPKYRTPEVVRKLRAIAYDCDHLGLPFGEEWDDLRTFAAHAVAALKLKGDDLVQICELPFNRKLWSEQDKQRWASLAFKVGTEWLVYASLEGHDECCPYPGEVGVND